MRYEIMRLICMFDLPVETSEEKRAYRYFRKTLIKEGFVMMQYSVYVRTCPNRDYANRLSTRLGKNIPTQGNIRIIMITEKQYEDMQIVIGTKSQTEKILGTERLIKL